MTARSRLFQERAARWIVTGGGVGIIAAIFGILLFILIEVWPVFGAASVSTVGVTEPQLTSSVQAVIGDEYRTLAVVADDQGTLRVVRLTDGSTLLDRSFLPEGVAPGDLVDVRSSAGGRNIAASSRSGQLFLVPVAWQIGFDEESKRTIEAVIGDTVTLELTAEQTNAEQKTSVVVFDVTTGEGDDSGLTAAALLEDRSLVVLTRSVEENLFTGDVSVSSSVVRGEAPEELSAIVLDPQGKNLYAGSASGKLYWWRLRGTESLGEPQVVPAGDSGVSALCLLLGGRSLIAGSEDGSVSVWFPVRDDEAGGVEHLTRIRDLPRRPSAVETIVPSARNRTFLVVDAGGELALYFSTSNRLLWSDTSPLPSPSAVFFSPRGDGVLVSDGERLARLEVDNPHPEVSWSALFSKVWYEGYPEPDHVWQSSSGTDDFEPKLGLTPLLIGTLKGTFYALLLAVPLAVLGAMYTSQFLSPRLQGVIKPSVEVMAALPSVILGFLAGLWLAPKLEMYFTALLVAIVAFPAIVLLTGRLWMYVPAALRNRLPAGSEALVFMVTLTFGVWLSLTLSGPVDGLLFGGNFQNWLLQSTGLQYDQRNAVVIGLAMGFAVIPIIFTISEEAFSSVPRNLVSGSLALGASRWQTVWRVVLPTASPGVFSGIMVGFGRAVGETMIVLMATGNTPIMDWNPFNGFRTLSANIAVEIPEAPHGGTLYRTLFLAALLLFIVTFLINTVADTIRQRLRKRYANI